jgi:hypothetical protein
MSFVRQAFGLDPRTFGRRFEDAPEWPPAVRARRTLFSEDLKLFAATFIGGFVFVSVYLA